MAIRRYHLLVAALLAALAAIGLAVSSGSGSSHREAPLSSIDPTGDDTDVYAFVAPDAPNSLTLVANWIPFEDPAGGRDHRGDVVLVDGVVAGRWKLVADLSYFGSFRIAESGLEYRERGRDTFTIVESDPLAAEAGSSWSIAIDRGRVAVFPLIEEIVENLRRLAERFRVVRETLEFHVAAGLGGHLDQVVLDVLQQRLAVGRRQVGERGPDRRGVAGDLAVHGGVHAASSRSSPSRAFIASVNPRQVLVDSASSARPASLTA